MRLDDGCMTVVSFDSDVFSSIVCSTANPQAMTLYGGRMTSARLREVGSVTSEAIERLHKYTCFFFLLCQNCFQRSTR